MSFEPATADLSRGSPLSDLAASWRSEWSEDFGPSALRRELDEDRLLPAEPFDGCPREPVLDVARGHSPTVAPGRSSGSAAANSADQFRLWMSRIVERDDAALAELYDACAQRVFAVVVRILPRAHQAEEVVGDCFWQVWREAPRYDQARGSVLGWIMAIARTRAIDALRRHDVFARHEVVFDDSVHVALQGHAQAPTDLLENVERDLSLHDLLQAMEPVQRQMLALAFFQGLTHQEISMRSGLALGTVKSHLRRALAQLRDQCVAAGIAPGIHET